MWGGLRGGCASSAVSIPESKAPEFEGDLFLYQIFFTENQHADVRMDVYTISSEESLKNNFPSKTFTT